MPPNYVHKTVHISALFYQSLSIISASGRKLLKMKNSNKFFLTPSTTTIVAKPQHSHWFELLKQVS